MTLVNHEQTKLDGLTLHTIETEKYKTTTIVLQLMREIEPDFITLRALLPQVLKGGTKKWPSSVHIHRYLEELYGATLQADVSKKGENQIISIRLDVANEKFLGGQTPLLEKALSFLAQLLLQPHIQGESFDNEIVKKEKRVLKQRIQSIYDDKMRYANKRLIEEMFAGELYEHHAYGKEEEVDAITAEDLYKYYQDVMKKDKLDLYIVGDVKKQEIEGLVTAHFNFPQLRNQEEVSSSSELIHKEVTDEKVVFDEQDIQQGKLHMGYRTSVTYGDPDYIALQVFNGVFGGFSHSKLFKNVREKESLAYYAVSRFESHKGALFVMSGIEFANYEKTVQIVKEQLESMKQGEFTSGELEQTKEMLKNQVLESIDSSVGLVETLYHTVISQKNLSLDQWMEGIDAVTKEEVVTVAKKVNLDTIYFLKGVETA
jgi:predicted Zn-dependent peptidase